MFSSWDSLPFNASISPEKKSRCLEIAHSSDEKSFGSANYAKLYYDEKSSSTSAINMVNQWSSNSIESPNKSENSLVWDYPSSDSEKMLKPTSHSQLPEHIVDKSSTNTDPSPSRNACHSPELFESDDSSNEFNMTSTPQNLLCVNEDKCRTKCDVNHDAVSPESTLIVSDNSCTESDLTPSLPSSIEFSQRKCSKKSMTFFSLKSSQSFSDEFPVVTLSP